MPAVVLNLNGESYELEGEPTVAHLLDALGLKQKPVAVEVNTDLIPADRHQQTILAEGDQVEVVTLVGGG